MADMINTLVTTTTSAHRWWMSRVLTRGSWKALRAVAIRIPEGSSREQLLMTLDDGREERVTPTSLIKAWSPDADPSVINARFGVWEDWVTRVLGTHTTHPMLRLFRSHHYGQNWITALGLMCDAAHHAQIIPETRNREAYWFLRRATVLFDEISADAYLDGYRDRLIESSTNDAAGFFSDLYQQLSDHGFNLVLTKRP